MQNSSNRSLASQCLLAHSSADIKLTTFITQVDKMLTSKNLHIVNGPNLTAKTLREAQQVIGIQENELKQYGLLCGATKGLIHFAPTTDMRKLQELSIDGINEYYTYYAAMTLKAKKCTCVGLSAVAFDLAKLNLKNYSGNNITIEICQLKNWSHTLLHLTQRKSDDDIESFFYDPWYQRCYTANPREPKVFPDEFLGKEMDNLICQTDMIEPTKSFLDVKTFKQVENTQRDYSYFVACSTAEFTNPAPAIFDPTIRIRQPLCQIL